MSTSNAVNYMFIQSTTTLRSLAQNAGNERREEAVAAKETMPVSKLTYTSKFGEVTTEYYKCHHQVTPNSLVANVVDYRKIESYYKPEVFAFMGPPIWIRTGHTAMMIPLLAIGSPKSTAKDKDGRRYNIIWEIGSIHYLAEDVTLETDEVGRVVFIFLLFKMRENGGNGENQGGNGGNQSG